MIGTCASFSSEKFSSEDGTHGIDLSWRILHPKCPYILGKRFVAVIFLLFSVTVATLTALI